MKKTCPLCKKINFQKKYEKTDLGFGFLTPDYPLVNLFLIKMADFLLVCTTLISDWLGQTHKLLAFY